MAYMENLEAAAAIVTSSSSTVSLQERRAAEDVFITFRNRKNPSKFCQEILDTSKNSYLLYEAATTLKLWLIRDWIYIPKEEIYNLIQYLLQFIIKNHVEFRFMRDVMSQVIAIIIKRCSEEMSDEEKGKFFTEIEGLILAPDNNLKVIGCSIISAIMQEYAVTVKSSDIGLTWEMHFKAKKRFEGSDLQRIFHFIVNILVEILNIKEMNDEIKDIFGRLISIAEETLTWSFISLNLPKRLMMSVFEQDHNPSLRPGQQWTDTFLNKDIVKLFFRVYWKVRGDWKMSYHALNCLIQLASLNGMVFPNRELRLQYLTQYLECLFMFLDSCELMEEEAQGFSNIFRKLLLFFPPSLLYALPKEMFLHLINHLTFLTCKFAEGSAMEEMVDQEDQLYLEALEVMLQSWSCILYENGSPYSDDIKRNSINIFDTYLKCHIGPPDGIRQPAKVEEIAELAQSDRVGFRDQLGYIGLCGRQVCDHSVPLLTKLLEERHKQLKLLLLELTKRSVTLEDNARLEALFEDIHWTLLVIGHVATMDNEGETALIPSELIFLSLNDAKNVNLEATTAVLSNPAKLISEIPNSSQCDPVIRLISDVFRLSETMCQALTSNVGYLLSPEVFSSLMWFLRRFSLTYLIPNESFYSEISVPLSTSFGRDSEGASWVTNLLLTTLKKVLQFGGSEPSLIMDTVNLLVTLADSKERRDVVLKSDVFTELVHLTHQETLTNVSSVAQRGLMQGLVMCAAALRDGDPKNRYWVSVLDPIITKFNDMISSEDFLKNYQDEKYKKKIVFCLDNFIGAIRGCLMSTAQCLFARLISVLLSTVKLLDLYHNYTEIVGPVMELFVDCGRKMLCFLNTCNSKQFYNATMELIGIYAKHNMGKKSLETWSSEEEQCRDLHLLLTLLATLVSKDFMDLAPSGHGEDSGDAVAGADVCLFGLSIVMPLIDIHMLQIPILYTQYYKLITFVAEADPARICQLNDELITNLLVSIELVLIASGMDIGSLAFDFIVVIGSYMQRNVAPSVFLRQKLKPLLNIIFHLIFRGNVNSDRLPAMSAALHTLICCYQDGYKTIVQFLIKSQKEPEKKARLTNAFTELMAGVELEATRLNRSKFRDNFEKFFFEISSFMFVK